MADRILKVEQYDERERLCSSDRYEAHDDESLAVEFVPHRNTVSLTITVSPKGREE